MRKTLILLAVLFQFFVLAYMAGGREFILRKGKTIYLRTAPIDPRDLFRGDFVRLNYEISRIPPEKLRGGLDLNLRDKKRPIYAVLAEGSNGLAELAYATDETPEGGLFIKGRPMGHWTPGALNVKYGIESYYVQQGRGRDIEKRMGRRTEVQIPLEMEIAIGRGGTAVIRGHRWSPLGMALTVLEQPDRRQPLGRKSAKFRLTLVNASDSPLALVNLPDHRSFSLEPWGTKHWVLAQSFGAPARPSNEDLILLSPKESRSFDFDFNSERWFVKEKAGPVETGTLPWSERFRIVYRPPSPEDCRSLLNKEFIWHGHLPSRAFHGMGNVD